MKKKVIVIGGGGHGKVVADIVKKSGDSFVGFLDDDLNKAHVIGTLEDCKKYKNCWFVLAVGNGGVRERIANRFPELKLYTAIHPDATIGEDCEIGKGSVVMARAVVNPGATVGENCIINTGAVVEHDCHLGDYVHISPGAVLCGTVTVGRNTHIGAGAVARNNISISENVTVGAGAVVVKNIEKPGRYIGVPAREMAE